MDLNQRFTPYTRWVTTARSCLFTQCCILECQQKVEWKEKKWQWKWLSNSVWRIINKVHLRVLNTFSSHVITNSLFQHMDYSCHILVRTKKRASGENVLWQMLKLYTLANEVAPMYVSMGYTVKNYFLNAYLRSK